MFLAKIGDTTSPPPVSAFLSSDTALCEKFCISFSDQSLNNPVSWNWIFDGASPSTSSDQNPTNICYDDPGVFDVTLITTNANGVSDTLTLNSYITVYPNPFAPTITQNGNVLTSSLATTYQWYLNSNIIPGATDQSYTMMQSGLYTVEIGDENGCKSQSSIEATVTGINDVTDNFIVTISGNPSNDQLTIESTSNSICELQLVNAIGERFYLQTVKFNSSTKSFSIDLTEMPSGIYFLVVHSGAESKTFKVVKQ
jgi:PKD repeat protein